MKGHAEGWVELKGLPPPRLLPFSTVSMEIRGFSANQSMGACFSSGNLEIFYESVDRQEPIEISCLEPCMALLLKWSCNLSCNVCTKLSFFMIHICHVAKAAPAICNAIPLVH